MQTAELEAGQDDAASSNGSNGHRRPAETVTRVLANSDVRFGQLVAAGTLIVLIFVGFLFPAPPAILFLGLVLGSLNALLAVGLVLIYRANRIINFAQGDLGGVAGILAVSLIVGWQWPFFLAIAVGFIAALMLGALTEFLIIRRFAKSPRLILTVATIGLAQIFAFGQLVLPRAFGFELAPQDFGVPFTFSFDWFPVTFEAAHLLVMIVVPVVVVGLAGFFRYTRTGIAVRASAESADRAALLGIPVKRVITLVWVLAAALSGLAVLLRAPIVGVSIGSVVGFGLLLHALAAAVIARMENLPVAFGVALLLGVVEQSVLWATGRTLIVDAVLFVIILGGLLMQRKGTVARAQEAGAATWQAVKEVRPIPGELRHLPVVRNTVLALTGAFFFLITVPPLWLNASQVNLLGVGLIFAMVCLSLVILTGWAGQISLGQMAFVAFGAAVGGTLAGHGHHFFVSLLAGGLVGAGIAILIGLPALRIPGLFLAVTTFAFALATGSYLLNREFFPWLVPEGRVLRPTLFGKFDLESEHTYYYLLLILLLGVITSAWSLRNSRTGRTLVAIRDNTRAAQSYGISPVRARLTAFGLSGFIAGLAGAAFVFHQHAMPGMVFGLSSNLAVFSMVVIGGLGSIPGALLGAAYYTFLNYSPLTRLPATRLFGSGVGLLIILLFLPGGLGGLLYDIRDGLLRRVARAKGIIVPSLVADVRTATAAEQAAVEAEASLEDAHLDSSSGGGPPAPPSGETPESVLEGAQQ